MKTKIIVNRKRNTVDIYLIKGIIGLNAPCPRCGGTGTFKDGSICYYCDGKGTV